MPSRHYRATVILLSSIGVWSAAASTSQAGMFPSLCPQYSAYATYYAGPAYTFYRPVYWSSAYRPVYWSSSYRTFYRASYCCPTTVSYAPACSPCDPCRQACYDPCGRCCPSACDPCCDPSQASPTKPSLAPNGDSSGSDWQRRTPTFRGNGESTDSPADTGTEETPYVPPADDTGSGQPDAFDERESFKPPVPDPRDEVIQQRKSAPAGDVDDAQESAPGGENAPANENPATDGTPADESATGRDASRRRPVVAACVELDHKITWHSTPKRTRLSHRSNLGDPRAVRRLIDVNSDWTPVPNPIIARK